MSTLCVPCICYPSLLSISDSVSVYPPQIVSCLSQDSLAHTLTNNVNDEGSVAMLPWFHHHTCKILTGFPSDFSPKMRVTKSTSDVTVARITKCLGKRLYMLKADDNPRVIVSRVNGTHIKPYSRPPTSPTNNRSSSAQTQNTAPYPIHSVK